MEEKKELEIYSYSKVWKVENKIYAIQNVQLPVPISPNQAIYFSAVVGILWITGRVFPVLITIPFAIKYVIIPYLVSKFLLTKKMDGKNPVKYILGIIRFVFMENDFCIERFSERPVKTKPIHLHWLCTQAEGRCKDVQMSD